MNATDLGSDVLESGQAGLTNGSEVMADLKWTGPTTYVDGLPYGQADHGGYEIEVNGQPAVAVPVAWNVDNAYSFPLADLPNLKQGSNAARLRTVAANGQVSDWTGAVTFPFLSTPQAPTNLRVE